MHDPARQYQIVLGALIGTVLGFVLVSLVFSAYGAAHHSLTWNDLYSIAGFWNGHLSLFTLIVIAMGLYLQARQFDIQLRAEQQERLRLRRDHAQALFQILDSRLTQIGEALQGYEVSRDDGGKAIARQLKGVWEIVGALRRVKTSEAEDGEIWADERLLTAYVRTAKELASISATFYTLSAGPGDTETLGMSSVPEVTGEEELEGFLGGIRFQRDAILAKIREAPSPPDVLDSLKNIAQLGWRLSAHQVQDKWYVTARCFAPERGDEFRISSDGSPDLVSASKDVASKWNARFEV